MLNLPLLQPPFAVDKELGLLILTFLYAAISPLQAVPKQPFPFSGWWFEGSAWAPVCFSSLLLHQSPWLSQTHTSLWKTVFKTILAAHRSYTNPILDTESFLQIRAWLWLPISPLNPQWAKQASQLCQFDFPALSIWFLLIKNHASLPSLDTENSKRIFVLGWQKSPELNQILTDP